jgi:glutathione synthase/RimK-type ligase-like ATP-grasp enzyme
VHRTTGHGRDWLSQSALVQWDTARHDAEQNSTGNSSLVDVFHVLLTILVPRSLRAGLSNHKEERMRSGIQPVVRECPQKTRPATVAVVAERRYLSHAQPQGMVSALERNGHSVLVIDPEERAFAAGDHGWMEAIDVALARGRSWSVLCLLHWLEQRSVRVVNRRSAIAAVHNKAEMSVRLTSAGIPVPKTFLGMPGQIARLLGPTDFPVIVKPVFGDNCRGLQVLCSHEELAAIAWPEHFAIVQRFIAGLEFDLKLYCIGREVWAVRKPSPLSAKLLPSSADRPAELLPMTAEWRNLALRCGQIFGLELFGVDCIETSAGPLVIEVNEFPNYSAVPGADEKLSQYVVSCLKQESEQ